MAGISPSSSQKRSSKIIMSEQEQNTQKVIMESNSKASGGGGNQYPLQQQRNSASSLFLTLPSNFSPSSMSPRNSLGGSGSTTPPTGTGSSQMGKGSTPSRCNLYTIKTWLISIKYGCRFINFIYLG